MENWAKRVNCKMEHGPMHPPVSQKIHWQPDLPVRHFNYTRRMQNIQGDGALVNRKSSSVVTPLPPAFAGAPLENLNDPVLIDLAATGIVRTTVAPFERVKLLMQNQNGMIRSGRLPQPYNGIFDCFARTIRNEGIFSLWRGNIATAAAYVSSKAIHYKSYEYFASRIDSSWSIFEVVAAGVFSTAANLFLVYPLVYAGTRMANDVKTANEVKTANDVRTTGYSSNRQFNGILDVYRKTLKVDGISGLFRGYTMAIAQVGVITALSALSRPWYQHLSIQSQNNDLGIAILDCVFDCSGSLASYPLGTVSRRMMMTSGEAVKYKSSRNAFAQIFKTEGFESFYKGAGADILVSAAFKGSALLLPHLYAAYFAAMANWGDGSQPGFVLSIKWKKDRDK
ncbi:ADP,ATP carrier protein-like [Herrania umbratica]|uniref:ADP/ATP translocase n=1 Tax=Herrania umbratica TaxID=108875 RepID=A0A6J1B6C7_9ROSI|nr:ADP,ATP carrier protein-like [Herrania umbratica]